jgi:acyl-CoA thioesterase-1
MQDEFGRGKSGVRAFRAVIVGVLVLFATCAHSASKSLLVLGDSLSAEYGLPRGTGWVNLLQERLKKDGADAVVINASISGETTSGGNTRLPELLAQYHPSLVLIELGANDGLRGLPLKAAKANLRSMIVYSKKAGAKVLLVGMRIPPNYGRDYTEKFSALFSKLAQETNVALVPFLLEGVASKPELFQNDRLHPTAEAQSIIVDNVWPRLKPLLTR